MYMPIGFAMLDDFRVAADDADAGAFGGAAPWRELRLRRISVARPASRMKVTTSASALAPETARSFTVPLTASSPIEPPGKRSGLTTKLSVVMATRAPLRFEVSGVAQAARVEAAEEQRREQPFDQPAAGFAAGAVRHLDLRVAEADFRRGDARSARRQLTPVR